SSIRARPCSMGHGGDRTPVATRRSGGGDWTLSGWCDLAKRTATSSFGASKREAHDASAFYGRNLYGPQGGGWAPDAGAPVARRARTVDPRPESEFVDRIYHHSAEDMHHVPDGSV